MRNLHNEMNRRSFIKTGGILGLAASSLGLTGSSFLSQQMEAAEIAEAISGKTELPRFLKAVPVWAEGLETEMNRFLVFTASLKIGEEINKDLLLLRMTGATIARVKINGEFVGYGPARGPHGWFRIDQWAIGKFLHAGNNHIEIAVAGYNCNSYYHLDQPSFLQAEIIDQNNNVLIATEAGSQGKFQALDLTGVRIQKVQRFSFQRPFIEVYDLNQKPKSVKLAKQSEVRYLPRRVPYPEFEVIKPQNWLKSGHVSPLKTSPKLWRDRSLVNISPKLKGFKINDLDIILSDKMQMFETKLDEKSASKKPGAVFKEGDVQIVDLGANYVGFFAAAVKDAKVGSELVITFDEILGEDGDVNFKRLGTCSAIQWTLAPGINVVEAFEPQVGRYAKIHCLKGSFTLSDFFLRDYSYPQTKNAKFACSDARLEKLYKAAVLTFRENSVDAFTDCPHRERAGWLCDSFFTARTAFDLTGKTDVENVFFENYQLPDHFEFLPDGMLPMCYPADHNDGVYIPNWALWFVIELKEYAKRNPDQYFVKSLKIKIEKLMKFFSQYENSDGLLEKLPSWVFVEWSKANSFVQDVNYPSNMLYAAALSAAGQIYKRPDWEKKAAKIQQTIIQQSYDGTFFVDNAKREKNGSLKITRNRSEVCQYFAFFFKTATPSSHPKLWKILLDKFGPNRIKNGNYPEVHQANSFVGNVLRLELLSMADRGEQLLEESVAYNEYMADRTGTLWENDSPRASCNHGFASHVCHVLYRDVLGISKVDPLTKNLIIRFQKFENLTWAEGVQPIPGGSVHLRWEKKDGKILYSISAPGEYKITMENATELPLELKK